MYMSNNLGITIYENVFYETDKNEKCTNFDGTKGVLEKKLLKFKKTLCHTPFCAR